MRTVRLVLASSIVIALLAAACGRLNDSGSGGGISHQTGSDRLVVRVETGGGLIAPTYAARQIPGFSLFGDGSLITEGPQIEIYPGPAMPNVLVQTISEDGIQTILAAARSAGLLGADATYGFPCIADAGTTTFTAVAEGTTHVVSAYALSEGEPPCSNVDTDARAKLIDFWTKLGDLRSWLPEGSISDERPYEARELRVSVLPGQASPDPSLEQQPVDWPLATSLADFGAPDPSYPNDLRCGVVAGDDFATLLPAAQRANELTPWVSGGEEYLLLFRPLLPDEHGC